MDKGDRLIVICITIVACVALLAIGLVYLKDNVQIGRYCRVYSNGIVDENNCFNVGEDR